MPKSKTYKEEVQSIESKELDKIEKMADNDEFKSLSEQVRVEYKVASDMLQTKFAMWKRRLKMYNNQMREDTTLGDPLIFTVLNTVLANLYDNRLMVKFQPREIGDTDTADNLTRLARYDYEIMEKDILDYDWDWDTLFFGKGLILFNYFDRELKTPLPLVLDPTTFLRDPRAYSINGNKFGMNRTRFCGWEMEATRAELKASGLYDEDVIDSIKERKNEGSIIDQNRDERNTAKGMNPKDNWDMDGENKELKIVKWFTVYKGRRIYVELGNNMKLILRKPLELDGLDIPIIERSVFRMSHDWDNTSIPDLLEDKQKAKGLLLNLSLENAKSGLHTRYAYNTEAITNKNDLNYAQDKHIGIKPGFNPSNVIMPIQHSQISAEVQWVMGVIQNDAERATGSPAQSQGMQGDQVRTATELAQISGGAGTRFALHSKVFQWSEKRFWEQWYKLYKEHFEKDIDEKIIRITGATSNQWRTLRKDNIISRIDPDITIESDLLSDAKRQRAMQAMTNYINIAMTYPNANKLYTIREYGRLSGLEQEVIDAIIPPSIDEVEATKENEKLNNNEREDVDRDEDHVVHLEIHGKANDTQSTRAHRAAHEAMMAYLKEQAMVNQNPQPSQAMPNPDMVARASQPIQPLQPTMTVKSQV